MSARHAKAGGKLRIIGGRWRSRILPVLDLPGLRPTTDRVRETLFNWLQNDISAAHCLDLFAGSGAIGFEAASRGAASVTMLEVQANAAKLLAENIRTLQADNIQLLAEDALSWLQKSPPRAFDMVFLDPPFESDHLARACELLDQQAWLADDAFIYLEMDSAQDLPDLPPGWSLLKEKKAGQVRYYLAQRQSE